MNILTLMPLANFGVLLFGFVYGISILKIALKDFTERLKDLDALVVKHEHRITILEAKHDGSQT